MLFVIRVDCGQRQITLLFLWLIKNEEFTVYCMNIEEDYAIRNTCSGYLYALFREKLRCVHLWETVHSGALVAFAVSALDFRTLESQEAFDHGDDSAHEST